MTSDFFTHKHNKLMENLRETFGLGSEVESEQTSNLVYIVPDFGYCAPGCKTCDGVGLIRQGSGWSVCPNNPRRFYGTGVSEEDKELWNVLPQTKIVERIKSTLDKVIQAKRGFIYLHGTPGIGKSVCARAYTVEAVQSGMKSIYARQSGLINHLRSSYSTDFGQQEYELRINTYKEADWLVIDELGRDRMTDFAQESLAEIIDSRYTQAWTRNKVTVLVSNFPPEDIFQAYIVDRIRDKRNVVLSLQGKSLRA